MFGSQPCTYFEWKYHSTVGETAYGRWKIGQNIHLIWVHNFWWLRGCIAIKEILEYEVSVPIIFCWAQELLVYHFSIVHQSNKTMTDADALTRRFKKPILQCCIIASIL